VRAGTAYLPVGAQRIYVTSSRQRARPTPSGLRRM